MTTVGQNSIFLIEWVIDYIYEKRAWGMMSYVANDQLIDRDGTVISGAVIASNNYESDYSKFMQVPIDFTEVSKEDIFECLFETQHTGVFPEKYREFYSACKKLMIQDFHAGKLGFSDSDVRDSISRGSVFTDDMILGGWILGTYEVTDLGVDAFLNNKIYLVRDIAKHRERLVWKRLDKVDKEGNIVTDYPVCEAVLPVGYFAEVQKEFAEVAAKEIEQFRLEKGESS